MPTETVEPRAKQKSGDVAAETANTRPVMALSPRLLEMLTSLNRFFDAQPQVCESA